jgi:hypothetical protein
MSETPSTRNAQVNAALRYDCEGIGHFAREYPTRFKKEAKTTDSTGRNPTERLRRSRSPGDKPPLKEKRKIRWEAKSSGNDDEA